ncbi:AAA+ family ATPase [filamentous cyanobacterium CCP2]|nr:AAA+ family ATPase [filamentous cyanobacterium CCP2]
MLSCQSILSLQRQAASLLLYQSVLDGAIGQAFLNLLQTLQQSDVGAIGSIGSNRLNRNEIGDVVYNPEIESLYAYGRWFSAMAEVGLDWQNYLIGQILEADNPFTRAAQRSTVDTLSPVLVKAAQQDLQALQSLYRCDGKCLSQWVKAATDLETAPIAWEGFAEGESNSSPMQHLPIWKAFQTAEHWADLVFDLASHYRQFGSGIFAAYWAFRWQAGQLVGIAYPDPIQLNQLVGYTLQKETLIQNTEALLAGYPALHVLLYGSRGSGKSSLVKALLQAYGQKGLRLIEVSKAELKDLPAIVDSLRTVPQKFIIFVDDLSFEEDDDAYKALKVVLEGNITARPQNVVVYATSNRRHLIREFFGDRPRPSDADEIHAWDTVQEKLSFSDRFGITLTFEPADQSTYLEIVHHLADLAQIHLPASDLEARALQWATRHNGRSGRTARQFVDFLKAEMAFPTKAN